MNDIDNILNKCTTQFLEFIMLTSNNSYSKQLSKKNGGFPIFFDNRIYNTQSFFDEMIEWCTWKILVNDVLQALFSEDYCSKQGIRCEWMPMHPQLICSYVEKTENFYPLEFVITKRGRRIGYRYTNCYWSEEKMNRVFEHNSLDELKIIDFSSSETSTFLHPLNVSKKFLDIVCLVKWESFFCEYFSKNDYDKYLIMIKKTVDEAYKYVGFQTVPNLTLQYMPYFIKKELNEVGSSSLSYTEYKVMNFDDLKSRLKSQINRASDSISAEDYKIMDDYFYNQRRYYAMCGGKSFAQSFLTSEYLYHTMQTNNHFDYTVIVAGYLKAIEQLLYKTVMLTLRKGTEQELWIKYKYVKNDMQPEIRNYNHTKHVRFVPENINFFDTSFGSMVNLLNVNANDWKVSKNAKNHIITCLNVFCEECRNKLFHKDNISIENCTEVEVIRHNTIILFYYLLGAYAYSGNIKQDREVLGIRDRFFDRMYQAIMERSAGGGYFILGFTNGKDILCALPINHGTPMYDENGSMNNPRLRFVRIDRNNYDDWHKDDWHRIEEDIQSDLNIYITPANVPEKIQYVDKITGERVDVEW